jgi:DNA-directed RNA polymerase specialized sigma24 family protein
VGKTVADLPKLYTSNIPLDIRVLFDNSFVEIVKENKGIRRTIKALIGKYELDQSLYVDSVLGDCYERGINALERGKVIENIEAWIRSTARHCIQEASRARCKERKNSVSMSDRPDFELIDDSRSSLIDLDLIRQDMRDAYESLQSLTALEKKIVILRASGKSFAKIAAQLVKDGDYDGSDALHNTLSQKYNRAIKKIRKKKSDKSNSIPP